MRKRKLPNTKRTLKKLEKLPGLCIGHQWAKWTTLSAPSSHFEENKSSICIPYVYTCYDENDIIDKRYLEVIEQ